MIRRALAQALTRPLALGEAIGAGPFERRDAIVVLGAPLTPDQRPSAVLAERLAVALTLWRGGAAGLIVVTGGATRGGARAEADAMASALRGAKVDAAAIAIEGRARSTADNARLVRALAPEVRTIWLATQRFHTRRATRLFRAHGFDVRAAYPAAGLEASDPGRALRWAAREYAAWVLALLPDPRARRR
ncbi:MAG: YdcF family protein [Myxococcales bacterium]|nr:YdcF family protein [Myxococcales bacterium]